MKAFKFLGISAVVVLAMSSCSNLRYTNYGRPLDFLHAKSHKAVPAKVENREQEVASKTELKKVEKKNAERIQTSVVSTPKDAGVSNAVAESRLNNDKADVVSGAEVVEGLSVSVEELSTPVSAEQENRYPTDQKQPNVDEILLILLCIFIPPLAVYLVHGLGTEFWIDLILTLIFFLPGIIYAIIVCLL